MSKNNKWNSFIHDPAAVYDVPGSQVSAIMATVGDASKLFELEEKPKPKKIDGKKFEKLRGYVPWGSDNTQPYEIANKIRSCEVMNQNMIFNINTCYGAGLSITKNGEKNTLPDEVKKFFQRNRPTRYLLEQITDMKHFMFTVTVVILNKTRDKIVQMRHKDAAYCRFETCNPKTGRIENLYFANWKDKPSDNDIEVIPVLDMQDPIGDLMIRTGKEEDFSPEKRSPDADSVCKYAIVSMFPSSDGKYYPFPYYASIFLSGWYDIKQLIQVGKKAKMKNHGPIRYVVEIHRDYWEGLFEEAKCKHDKKKQLEIITAEKLRIKKFLGGIENSGKMFFTGFYTDALGKEQKLIRISTLDTQKEGGDWIEDSEEASNYICYSMNIHPSLIGATPGKNKGSFSGSDKRELFTMKQLMEKPTHDLLLDALFVINEFNNWGVDITIPVITLTTLDKGKDAEKHSLNNPAQNDN